LGSRNKYTYRAGKAQRWADRNALKRKMDKKILNGNIKLKRYIYRKFKK